MDTNNFMKNTCMVFVVCFYIHALFFMFVSIYMHCICCLFSYTTTVFVCLYSSTTTVFVCLYSCTVFVLVANTMLRVTYKHMHVFVKYSACICMYLAVGIWIHA